MFSNSVNDLKDYTSFRWKFTLCFIMDIHKSVHSVCFAALRYFEFCTVFLIELCGFKMASQ